VQATIFPHDDEGVSLWFSGQRLLTDGTSENSVKRQSDFGEGRLADVQLPKALRPHDLRRPSRPSLIGDRGDRVCTASSSLDLSQFYSPSTVFRDEDLEAHRRVSSTLSG
jgi:hypothetical protein